MFYIVILPNSHMASNQNRINVNATPWRRLDADTTLYVS